MKKLLLATSILTGFSAPIMANAEDDALMRELRAELAKELGFSENKEEPQGVDEQFEQELKKEFAKGLGHLSNELMEIDIDEDEILVTSDADQLIITDITINRGNCYGWKLSEEIENLGKMIPLQEKKLLTIKEDRLKDTNYAEPGFWDSVEREQKQRISDLKAELLAYQRDKGIKLAYGEKKGFGYVCSDSSPREIKVKLIDGTESIFKNKL